MPNYRFYYLLQKALELCSELKALGNSFLSTKEKGDAEALSRLRAKHESGIQNLVMEVKKQQLEESQKSLESLQQSRKSPEYRLRHYLNLIGEDTKKVPADVNTDFAELADRKRTHRG